MKIHISVLASLLLISAYSQGSAGPHGSPTRNEETATTPARTQGARFHLARERGFIGLDEESEGEWRGPFFFVQLADPQYGLFSKNIGGMREEEALVARAVAHINRLKPRFAVVCGDLTHATPGHERYEEQVPAFQDGFSRVDPAIPLLCLCGNHDVGNRPTPKSIASYRDRFGDDYFGFWVGGVRGIVLNSSIIKDPSGAPRKYRAQAEWLATELESPRAVKPVHVLVFQHHPWFLSEPDEEDQYFNMPIATRLPALAQLKQAGVRAVLAGHYHRLARGNYEGLEMITTGSVGQPFGKDPSGLRIVEVYRDRIEHEYYGLDDVPQSVVLDLE